MLYTTALVTATCTAISREAPDFPLDEGVSRELAGIVLESCSLEGVTITKKAFDRPSLNPAFVRYKEKIRTLLRRFDENYISNEQTEIIVRKLGLYFKECCDQFINDGGNRNIISNFIDHLDSGAIGGVSGRNFWLDYEAHLNDIVYRNLFLKEIEGHPDVTLKELYVPSRAVYIERIEDLRGSDSVLDERVGNFQYYAFDLAEYLLDEWLMHPVERVGHSRLITGDPGTGKSTFSLMFAHGLINKGFRVSYIPANSIR